MDDPRDKDEEKRQAPASAWKKIVDEAGPGDEWEDAALRARIEANRRRRLAIAEQKRQRRRWLLAALGAGGGLVLLCVAVIVWFSSGPARGGTSSIDFERIVCPDWIDQQFIDLDGGARDGVQLEAVRDIAIHYVGNPGTTAMQNRNYFNRAGV